MQLNRVPPVRRDFTSTHRSRINPISVGDTWVIYFLKSE